MKNSTSLKLNSVRQRRECAHAVWNAYLEGVTGGCSTKKDTRKRNHEHVVMKWGKRNVG